MCRKAGLKFDARDMWDPWQAPAETRPKDLHDQPVSWRRASCWIMVNTYCWWKKSCTSWCGEFTIIFFRVLYIPGFLPPTVCHGKTKSLCRLFAYVCLILEDGTQSFERLTSGVCTWKVRWRRPIHDVRTTSRNMMNDEMMMNYMQSTWNVLDAGVWAVNAPFPRSCWTPNGWGMRVYCDLQRSQTTNNIFTEGFHCHDGTISNAFRHVVGCCWSYLYMW